MIKKRRSKIKRKDDERLKMTDSDENESGLSFKTNFGRSVPGVLLFCPLTIHAYFYRLRQHS